MKSTSGDQSKELPLHRKISQTQLMPKFWLSYSCLDPVQLKNLLQFLLICMELIRSSHTQRLMLGPTPLYVSCSWFQLNTSIVKYEKSVQKQLAIFLLSTFRKCPSGRPRRVQKNLECREFLLLRYGMQTLDSCFSDNS